MRLTTVKGTRDDEKVIGGGMLPAARPFFLAIKLVGR